MRCLGSLTKVQLSRKLNLVFNISTLQVCLNNSISPTSILLLFLVEVQVCTFIEKLYLLILHFFLPLSSQNVSTTSPINFRRRQTPSTSIIVGDMHALTTTTVNYYCLTQATCFDNHLYRSSLTFNFAQLPSLEVNFDQLHQSFSTSNSSDHIQKHKNKELEIKNW